MPLSVSKKHDHFGRTIGQPVGSDEYPDGFVSSPVDRRPVYVDGGGGNVWIGCASAGRSTADES